MKKTIFSPVQLLGSLLVMTLLTLVGCSTPTDHVGLWNAIEKDGKALAQGASMEYLFGADGIASLKDVTEDGRLNLSAYEIQRSGNELSLVGIENESQTYQIEIINTDGKEQMKLTNADGTILLEKKSAGEPAITDSKYHYLYYPVTFVDDESSMRMTFRFFNNGHLMLDSYQMNYKLDTAKGLLTILNQGNPIFQITIVSETEWEFGAEGQGSSRKEVIITKR